MPKPTHPQESVDFSLVLGGPLYQLLRRAHLSGSALELVQRRALVFALFAWLPLAALTTLEGHFLGSRNLSFSRDIESHVRFLVALPILIVAELIVHRRLRLVVRSFTERGVITPDNTPRFRDAIAASARAQNSLWLELALLIFVFTGGHWIWRYGVALGATSWYAIASATGTRLTLAGYWYSLVSIPIFQFILLRWYLRLTIWFLFLWRVSRLDLRLLPAHPDRAGGISFLGKSSYVFSPILFAQGCLLAGVIASRIFYQGESLMSFKATIVSLIGFFVLVILGSLAMFSPQLARVKRRGLREYGALATAYVADFDEKWIQEGPVGEKLLGTPDIQSLADLANSYAVVSDMRLVPFALQDITRLVGTAALPILPLLLTVMPLEEMVTRLIKIIF